MLFSYQFADSNVEHLEEIRKAGLELPAVNQIEVRRVDGTILLIPKCSYRCPLLVASLLSAEANCEMVPGARRRH